MADSVQIASWEGGELRVPAAGGKLREVVLALPLSRLLVKVIRIPSDQLEDPAAFVTPILKAMSPYPDEPLAVSCETLRETEEGRIVLAVALPEGSAEDVASVLDASGLNVTRIDALPLGLLPEILSQLAGGAKDARRLLLMGGTDCLSLFVLDDDLPVAVRAISPGADLRREVMLSLLEAEEFGGAKSLSEVVTVGEVPVEGLDLFAPVRALTVTGDPLAGIAARSLDPETCNALPDSWREVLGETRFKRKMKFFFGVAGAIWFLAMTVLIGVPRVYQHKIDNLRDRKEQTRQYNRVQEKKKQVEKVKAMSNHDTGALETLRAVVNAMPPAEMELSRWNFKRDDNSETKDNARRDGRLTFSGVVSTGEQKPILKFKDNLSALRLSQISEDPDDAETPFFGAVNLPRGISIRTGKSATFDIECSFLPPKEDQ